MTTSIQYLGVNGCTQDCLDALRRFIQYGDLISKARLISYRQRHAFIITIGEYDFVAIRAGFSSGYLGGGPTGLSSALRLLVSQGIEIEEVEVNEDYFNRINNATLTLDNCKYLVQSDTIRPSRVYDYIHFRNEISDEPLDEYHNFPAIMPFRIIDDRLLDLALSFNSNADTALLTAFRRLESIVRERSGLNEHGSKLFSQAFGGKQAPLAWPSLGHENETAGRVNLFVGAYMTHRNPRAHSDLSEDTNLESMLSEFLIINHLFLLERTAVSKTRDSSEFI